LPKGNEHARKLFAVCEAVAERTWKRDAEEKLEAIWGAVDKGVAPKNSDINIQDGDLYNRDHNRGTWQIKATRRVDEGAPEVLDQTYAPIDFDTTDEDSVNAARVLGPKQGDLCYFLIRVWGQKKRERLNFSLEAVTLVQRGTLREPKATRAEIASKFGKVKGLPSGFSALALGGGDDVIDAETVAAPSAKVAKGKPVEKKDIFRGKGKR
jgi:hypothetical protein